MQESRSRWYIVHAGAQSAAVLYRKDDLFLAHCLEFDLVAQGDTAEQAYHNLLDAIELRTAFVREQGALDNLIQPAPVEYWQMLASAERFTPPANGWQLPSSVSAMLRGWGE